MNGFGPPDDKDTCDCVFGKPCDWHAQQQARERSDWEQRCEYKGIDPDADIDGIENLILEVELSDALSQHQKDAIMRILMPRKQKNV